MDHSGIFTLREFQGREVLKLAPDAFIEINGGIETKVISSQNISDRGGIDMRGGVSSISIQSGVTPGGSSNCSISVIAPQYKGFHKDYYITLPSGAKVPVFIPMMEVKVFMKGRFLRKTDQTPIYYQVFWGFIKDVSENYSGGSTTFSLSCCDMLAWWKYQTIMLQPAVTDNIFGGAIVESAPTVFKDLNGIEVIVKLFTDTAFNSFVVPKLSNVGIPPDSHPSAQAFGALTRNVIDYWSNKYFFVDGITGEETKQRSLASFLEIYGFGGKITVDEFQAITKNRQRSGERQKLLYGTDPSDRVSVDFNVMEFVQPFGAFENFKLDMTGTVMTKLEIANVVCEQMGFEFFLDLNGSFVFKPPFFNLNTKDVETYRIRAKEIYNFSAQFNTDNLITFLEVTSPMIPVTDALEHIGFHADFDLMARYGLRHDKKEVRYGNTAENLRQIAVGEMGRLNSKAFTANMSIPLRPEMRLGYPVYIEHIDAYYYVTGINHSFTFGSSAQTDLILEARRERVYTEDGSKILKAHVYRRKTNMSTDPGFTVSDTILREEAARKYNNLSSGMDPGYYEVKPARTAISSTDALIASANNPLGFLDNAPSSDTNNELVTFTRETVPYTDINGYRHIGGFAYGANLKLNEGGRTVPDQVINAKQNGIDLVDASEMVKPIIPGSEFGAADVRALELNRNLDDTQRLFTVGEDVMTQEVKRHAQEDIYKPISTGVDLSEFQSQTVTHPSSDALSFHIENQSMDSRRLIIPGVSSEVVLSGGEFEIVRPDTPQSRLNFKIASVSVDAEPKTN